MTKEKNERRDRSLTEADVEAIVDSFENRMEQRFFVNLGRGIWAFVWRAAIAGLLMLAAWGHYKG